MNSNPFNFQGPFANEDQHLAKICAWVNEHDRCGAPAAEVKDGAVVIYTLCYAGDNAPRSEDKIVTDLVTTIVGARRVLGY